MTYRKLRFMLKNLSEEHLDDDVTVLLMETDEIVPVMDIVMSEDWSNISEKESLGLDQVDGVLDYGHPYLTIDM